MQRAIYKIQTHHFTQLLVSEYFVHPPRLRKQGTKRQGKP